MHVTELEATLDPGEAAALVLALEKSADFVLMDEAAGRKAAGQLGLTVIGVLGILLQAKRRTIIPTIRPLILRLQSELGFRLSPQVVAQVPKSAGE